MQITDGSIISQGDGYERKDVLFTYDENEKQQNEINKVHAKIMLHPKFIPMYPQLLQEGFTLLESCLYGFIDFFLSNNDKFYWSNKELADMFNVGETSISLGIKKLKDLGIIDITYRIKSNGGKIRFVKIKCPTFKIGKSDFGNLKDIDNKIIDNKIINKSLYKYNDSTAEKDNLLDSIVPLEEQTPPIAATPPLKKRKDIDELIDNIKGVCDMLGVAYDKTRDRMFAKHILDSKEFGEFCDKIGQDRLQFATNVLKASMKIKYFKGPCSGPMKIYQNYTDVYNQTITKHKSTVGVLPGIN